MSLFSWSPSNVGRNAVSTLARYPFVILCAWFGVAAAIASIHNDRATQNILLPFLMVAVLGVPWIFMLTTLRERLGKSLAQLPLEVVGIALLVGYYFTLPHTFKNAPDFYVFRFFLLLAFAHFAVAVVPFLVKSNSRAFWQFNRHLFLRFILTTLYSSVLLAGLEFAMFSADKLFDRHLSYAYGDLFCLIAGVLHPWFFLVGVPKDFTALETDDSFPKGLRAFTQFALAPLVAVYLGILYVYAVKILCTMTWPRGWVAAPVIALAIVGILAALLLYPLTAKSDERWAAWYWRWFFRALAPLSILLLLAVRERVHAYGVTEWRYLGIVAGFWILITSLLYCFRPRGIRWIPASLTVIALLAAFGPWSMFSISKKSQLARLEHSLQKFGLWKNGHAIPKKQDLAVSDYDNIKSTIDYIISTHGAQILMPLFVKARPIEQPLSGRRYKDIQGGQLLNWLKVTNLGKYSSCIFSLPKDTPLDMNGLRHFYSPKEFYGKGEQSFGKLQIKLKDGHVLAMIDYKDFEPLPVDALFKRNWDGSVRKAVKDLYIDWPKKTPFYRIYFLRINVVKGSDGSNTVENCKVLVMSR